LNLIVALNVSVVTWSVTMSIYGIVSKAVMFLIGYAVMRTVGVARRRRQQSSDLIGGGPAAVAPGRTDAPATVGGDGCRGRRVRPPPRALTRHHRRLRKAVLVCPLAVGGGVVPPTRSRQP
jgi:hypothetical protein